MVGAKGFWGLGLFDRKRHLSPFLFVGPGGADLLPSSVINSVKINGTYTVYGDFVWKMDRKTKTFKLSEISVR